MMKFAFISFLTVSLAFFLHILIVYYLPNVIMLIAFHQMTYKYKTQTNAFFHTGTPSPELRNVPKPDPNLLYSLCTYDVSKHPVRFTAPVPDCSWSISFYARNSTNFYATNDQTIGSNDFSLTLVGKKYKKRVKTDINTMIAPSDKGMVIIRISIMGHKHPEDLVQLQKHALCTPVLSY
ncbi:MAG: DUF1254 domain-containing protein [Proteobacteria bacterium]|nr:DUF1254 domain-containing protein [Pseudomonadota bacterium]